MNLQYMYNNSMQVLYGIGVIDIHLNMHTRT